MILPGKHRLSIQHMYVVFISAIFGFLVTAFIVNVSLNQFPAKDLEYRTKSSQKLESDTTLIRESSTMPKARIESFSGPYLPGQSANLIYHYNPSLLVWSMAIYILLTFSFATFPVGLLYLISLRKTLKITSRQMWSALLAALSVVTLSILMNLFGNGLLNAEDVVRIFNVLFKSHFVLRYIVVTSILLLSPFVALVFMASAGSSNIDFRTSADQMAGVLEKFDAIQTVMKASLVVITISIVLTVVTTGLLGDSIRAALTVKEFDVFPPQFGYVYGLYFSLFLFVLFTPSYFFIRFKQHEFLKKLKSTQGAEQAYNATVQSLMDTDQSLAKQVKVLLVMLLPFISSFLPGLIDHLF